jgi:hypothetical protein
MLMIAAVTARTVFFSGGHLRAVCSYVTRVLTMGISDTAIAAFWLWLVIAMLSVLVLVCLTRDVTGCFAGMVHTSADGDAAGILRNISTNPISAIRQMPLAPCGKNKTPRPEGRGG